MATQLEILKRELAEDEARLGPDAPFVKLLRQQLQGMELNERNRNERFLISTGTPEQESAGPATETEADGKTAGALRIARWKHQNEQFRKGR